MALDANFSVTLDANFNETNEFGAEFGTVSVVNMGVVLSNTQATSVFLSASAWRGEGGVYSQVVSVVGATDKSQVNLTPSAEQLAIFYDKSLAFVTENDDGVVTVYAIGQKPVNDYTIQATITEVSV